MERFINTYNDTVHDSLTACKEDAKACIEEMWRDSDPDVCNATLTSLEEWDGKSEFFVYSSSAEDQDDEIGSLSLRRIKER